MPCQKANSAPKNTRRKTQPFLEQSVTAIWKIVEEYGARRSRSGDVVIIQHCLQDLVDLHNWHRAQVQRRHGQSLLLRDCEYARAERVVIALPKREVGDGLFEFGQFGAEGAKLLKHLLEVGGMVRPQLVWLTRVMFGRVKSRSTGNDTFHQLDDSIETPCLKDYSLEQKVDYELRSLECPVSAHPVELMKAKTGKNGLVSSMSLPRLIGRHVRLLGLLDTTRGTATKNGDLMQFITMEDETGVFEVTLFPRIYRKFRRILTDHGPYFVEGKVEDHYNSVSVTANRIARFQGPV